MQEEHDYWTAVAAQEQSLKTAASDSSAVGKLIVDSRDGPLMLLLQRLIDNIADGKIFKNGPMPVWATMLIALGPGILHAVILRTYMDLLFTKGVAKGSVRSVTWASRIGKEINEIAAYKVSKSLYKEEWKNQSRFFKNWSIKRCRAFTNKLNTVAPLKNKHARKVGQALVEIAVKSGMFRSKVIQLNKFSRVREIYIDWEIMKTLEGLIQDGDIKYIRYRPMLAPPAKWSVSEPGGYYFQPFRKRVRNNSKLSKPYCDALNTLQSQEWEINPEILDLMKHVYIMGSKIGGIPSRDIKAIDIEKYPEHGTKEEKASWMRRKEQVWHEWAVSEAERLKMETRLRFATMYNSTFFHAWFPCFRGRMYTCCEILSPQGSSLDRALIRFAKPVPLTPEGLKWLKIYVANMWDQDKLPMADRIKWTEDNMEMLRQVAMDPLSNRAWVSPKKRKNNSWERLAATKELFRTDGMTQLPIQLDGSNNGLQHWAAMLRMNKLGISVNLTDTTEPQDVYQEGANLIHKELMAIQNPDPIDTMLQTYYAKGIPREIPKRPFMCYGYGITLHSVLNYTFKDGALDWIPDKATRKQAASKLGKITWKVMNQFLAQANVGKKWLTNEIRAEIKYTNKPWEWINPLGFLMVHSYPKTIPTVSRVRIWNQENHEMTFRDPSNNQSPFKNSTSAPPNFIHSLDSCHAVMTINRMANQGLSGYSFVHDSYGTYANNIETMRNILREEFVRLHKGNILYSVKAQFKHPKGTASIPNPDPNDMLDINKVLKSEYFFS